MAWTPPEFVQAALWAMAIVWPNTKLIHRVGADLWERIQSAADGAVNKRQFPGRDG